MPRPSPEDDLAACATAIRGGSRSFWCASLLLPPAYRRSAYALYAFCRMSDDVADAPGAQARVIDELRDRLERVYAGAPRNHYCDRAFADVVAAHEIPEAAPAALIEGMAWDLDGRRYDTLEDLEGYAARVAGAVGVMMAMTMGARDSQALARAVDLGVAMQFTNIARDVGEDARMGRLYLPRDWVRAEGLDPDAFLGTPQPCPEIARATLRLLDVAETLYTRAATGVRALPLGCRPAIHAARLIYREIGVAVRARSGDGISARAVVSTQRKFALLAQACLATASLRPTATGPTAGGARFLCAGAPAPTEPAFARVLNIIGRLENEDRAAA